MAGSYQRHAAFCYERDSWMCKLCGLPIGKNRVAPHPLSPSLDHIKPQVLGGSDEPDNLQTAHLRCNESKHVKAQRGSTLRVVMQAPPELLELLRRLPPVPEADEPKEPLPELSCETIGDVFDAAVEIARTAQTRLLPDQERLRAWVTSKGFVSQREAANAVFDQLYSCLDQERIRDAVAQGEGGAAVSLVHRRVPDDGGMDLRTLTTTLDGRTWPMGCSSSSVSTRSTALPPTCALRPGLAGSAGGRARRSHRARTTGPRHVLRAPALGLRRDHP